jgi:DNA ligase-associated metallophosphoesterase
MTGIDFCGHPLFLLPSGAAFDQETKSLFIADLHLGKSSVLRDAGLGVPDGPDATVLSRIGNAVAQTQARTLVVLGDFFHARGVGMEQTLSLLAAWRNQHPELRWVVVPGNHDRRITWKAWLPDAEILVEGAQFHQWRLAHHPPESSEAPVLCGHLHPGVSFGPARRRKVKAPCFWQRRGVLVLPAFGEFTGLEIITREPGDRVWIAVGEGLMEVPRI